MIFKENNLINLTNHFVRQQFLAVIYFPLTYEKYLFTWVVNR